MVLHDVLRRAERLTTADRSADALARVINKALPTKATELLRGAWLGHPVHPLLVAVPIGAWTSATVFDCVGRREAARQLIGLGLAAVPATVLAGLADYTDLTSAQRRTALVHACANTVGSALLAASYVCRRQDLYRTGVVLSAIGMAAVGVGGALGGHLSYAQGGGVFRFQEPPFVRSTAQRG